ncbi:MAG TPA: CinA family nicotinamide mononucleotide deamidase-related protein [Pseudomonadales bacterium]|nr:CinA family nicotinamide mononucleotide deamidase-related protein [Pseudomonadales bacterium]
MKTAFLLTGNELMSGDIVDSNSAEMAQMLFEIGLNVDTKVTVGDDRHALQHYIDHLSKAHDILIINGGLGPTQDDLTAEILAHVAGLAIEEHPQARAHLERWCEQRRVELSRANLKQAMLPAGCKIIPNDRGSAVGFELALNGCRVMTTPGVPSELRLMMRHHILPTLEADHSLCFDKLQCFGLGESRIQQMVHDQCPDWPSNMDLGFRAGMPLLEVKLRSKGEPALHAQTLTTLRELLGDHVVCDGNGSLPGTVVSLLAARGEQLTCAESCTGGRIASEITSVPGSSAVFGAGFVTYANAMKSDMLGVNPATLTTQGAVSEHTVREMALGAMRRSGAHWGVAVSGIAGPDGGTEDKPVGTVWIAWGQAHALHTKQLRLRMDRTTFQRMVSAICLDLLRRDISGITTEPSYFGRYL